MLPMSSPTKMSMVVAPQGNECATDDELRRRHALACIQPSEVRPTVQFVLRIAQLLRVHLGDRRQVGFHGDVRLIKQS